MVKLATLTLDEPLALVRKGNNCNFKWDCLLLVAYQ